MWPTPVLSTQPAGTLTYETHCALAGVDASVTDRHSLTRIRAVSPEAATCGSVLASSMALSDDIGLPGGVVTFLFTDVQGSTRLWEDFPDLTMQALDQHDAVIDDVVASHNGVSVKPRGEGDSRFVVFTSAFDAVTAVVAMQRGLAEVDWRTPRPLLVRMALHTGEADLQLGDYYGPTVNRAARLRAIAHGGQTIISETTHQLVQDKLPPGVSITDMGEHGLKDLTRPAHVFQIDIEGLPTGFPPLASLDAVRQNLPVQLTSFVGRQAELTQVKESIAATRFLTILGPGGTGKTRLAIQVAADLTTDFPQGVFFVDLAPIDTSDDIVQAIAEALGIALSTEEDLLSQLVTYLAAKRQLLVLDNFEHVTDGAWIASEILKRAPEIRIISTSRAKLGAVGETVMPLAGLETTWTVPDEALRVSSVRLFVDAAERADASFSLSAAELEPLGRIVQMVGGLPLGIVLAAAWVDVLSIEEIAVEIGKSLDFLESTEGDVVDRHRSVRAVFEYSWTMLTDDERQMFSALSVFRGGFTREAAEAVAGASLRNLSNLASKSLLVSDRDAGRYTVHELLRQYAEDALQADSDRRDTTVEAHLDYYAELAARTEDLVTASDQKEVLRVVEPDLGNIRAAWRTSLNRSDGPSSRKFIIALWFIHEIRGWHRAAIDLFGEALDAFDAESSDDAVRIARSSSSGCQAWFKALLGAADASVDQAAEAVATLAEYEDLTAYVIAAQSLCGGLMYLNRWEDLGAASSEAVARSEAAGEDWAGAEIKPYYAFAEFRVGNFEDGARLLAEADATLSRLGELRARGWTMMGEAVISLMPGDAAAAVAVLDDVVRNARDIGYRRLTQVGLQHLGDARVAAGDPEGADSAFVESLAMSEEMGSVLDMAGMLARIARVRAAMGRSEDVVSILSSVVADPTSRQTLMIDESPIHEIADGLLGEMERALDPSEYQAAYARGASRTIEVAARTVLTDGLTRSSHGDE